MKRETVLKAEKYFHEHKQHVMKMIKNTTSCFKPSEEDKDNFSLWKEGSWVWFLDTYRFYQKKYVLEDIKRLITREILQYLMFRELLQMLYLHIFKKVKFNMFLSLIDKGVFVGTALDLAKKFKV